MIRRLRAWLAWIQSARHRAAGLEALFTEPLLTVSPPDPAEVGRQESRGAAILDTADWLAANGFADVEPGDLQRRAEWLLERREAYERQGAEVS